MYEIFVILAVITAVLLAFIVLIQESKGGGLASNFSSSNQIMGVRKTTDFIEKATWTLASLLVIFSVASAFCLGGSKESNGSITDGVKAPAAQTAPAANNAQEAAPAPAAQQN
ncbi:MAG: preprotein translocase subunit SecG [Bacteroidaceae bacterium]|jgi:preprotein translocase subunit SecG|nr:preprotein translocase subunit SecG [Bacteroidaceae bacterium]